MILIGGEYVFRNPDGDLVLVKNLPDNLDELSEDYMYIIGEHVYDYVGTCPNAFQLNKAYPEGGAFGRLEKNKDKILFHDYVNENVASRYSLDYVMPEDAYNNKTNSNNIIDIVNHYVDTFKAGHNLADEKIKYKPIRNGYPYVPSFRSTDDPLERLLKITVASLKIISSESRNKMEKDYEFDNLVSTFEGMTKHTSIDKIMDWCNFLNLDWEFYVFGLENQKWTLSEPVMVSSDEMPWVDIDTSNQKEVFKVKLTENEDALKRLVKLFLDKINCPSSVYRSKGSTPHLVNNMMSGLKSKQKMTMKYFINWCNLLEVGFAFKFTRPDGVWYKSVGYEVTTNDPETYALDLISDIVLDEESD